MKKSIIAAGASVVLAAMPVMGAFAVKANEAITDNLNLTIANACTFERGTTNGGHTNGDGSWGDGTGTPVEKAVDTLYATVENGRSYSDLGKSGFTVTCNNKGGFQVAVVASAFSAEKTAANAEGDYAWAYTAGGTTVTTGDSMWSLSSTGDNLNYATNIVAKNEAPVSNKTFEITYMAFVDATQPADTYTASAAYTMTQL